MPYTKKEELPDQVRKNLPMEAQEIYLKAYNSALDQYNDPNKRMGNNPPEETASKVAWSAVKQRFHKTKEGMWEAK